jgi:hypothetical protein
LKRGCPESAEQEPLNNAWDIAMTELSREQIIQLISTIVARHGCSIIEMDVDNYILDIDGPAEAREACARELALFLD